MGSKSLAFDPKIVAFCCEQSGVFASEMADAFRLELPPNLEIITVPCAGRIETVFLLKTLENRADGVIIFACHENNCQYLRGNIRAKSRLLYAQDILSRTGLEKGRLEICNLATNSAIAFVETVKRKVEELRELGPAKLARSAL